MENSNPVTIKQSSGKDKYKRPYKTKSGVIQFKPSFKWIESAENEGFCLACGNVNDSVEPDARKYECECCGANKVYGNEELALMGLYF